MKPKKKKKPSPIKQTPIKVMKARESKLLDELCGKHGYMFQDAPKGQRISMTYIRNVPKPRVDASYRIFLIVPSTSALGETFAERYKQIGKAKK